MPAWPRPAPASSGTWSSCRCGVWTRSRRETTAIARRTRRARFEQTATLEGFDFTANTKLPAAQIRDLAALRWLQAAARPVARRGGAVE
jgi:DNA replication protein DnaC